MKEVKVKLIPIFLFIVVLPLFLFHIQKETVSFALISNNELEKTVSNIIKENNDKELIENMNFNQKFIYLAFKKDEEITSFLIDTKTFKNEDITSYVKPEKQSEFKNKINYLLYLKYPKYIADELSKEETNKSYEILKNELVIHYECNNIDNLPDEDLFLRVNYNEIKDCLLFTVSLSGEYTNENGYLYNPNKKAIAFTFDDGPNGAKTNKIVSLLEENKAHATFFMVGNRMASGKETILNVLNKGNEIGSHSYSHKNMKRMKLNDVLDGEKETEKIYNEITNEHLKYTRPPYGNITNKIKNELDTIFVNWSMDTEDWLHRNKDYVVNYVLEHVKDGDIILMHDLYDSTVEAVEELLPKLYKEGYQVVSISELAKLKGIELEEHNVYRSLEKVE